MGKLNPSSQSIECWTCGSRVQRRVITDRLDHIEQLVKDKRDKRGEIREQLSDLKTRRQSIQGKRARYDELTDRKSEMEQNLIERSDFIDDLRDDANDLREEIDHLQSELDTLNETKDEAFADYERISELEYERGQIEQEISDLNNDINEIEYLLGKCEDHEARREDIMEQITSLRSRVERLEKATTNTFNTHMEKVLNRLEYKNVKRVWLERLNTENETSFELHIVREDKSGTVYEDSIDHLSESEREVIGIIVAVAGYLTHDIQERIPMLLLDSLEAIDANRISDLVDYLIDHTKFLLIALLDEDAAALSGTYDRVKAPDDFGDV